MITSHDLEQQTDSLASYLPSGRLFEAAWVGDSNFRKLLKGLAGELFDAEGLIKQYQDEYAPDTTNNFISEWESALGIPDDCFSGSGTIIERRRDVMVKLAALGVQTAGDYEALALTFGKVVTVTALSAEALPPYNVPFNPLGLPGARFIIVVQGENLVSGLPPYDVPFDLIVGESILECLFRKVKPANCDIIFRNSN